MLTLKELTERIETVKSLYPHDAKELSDALGLLSLALDGLYESTTKSVHELMEKRRPGECQTVLLFPQDVIDLQEKVDEYSDALLDEKEQAEDIDEMVTDEEVEKRQLPDYAKYQVDSAVPHSLNDDYTYTKACGFTINGNYYDAKNMRDILVQTCGILAETDLQKMDSLVDDPTMKGRKVIYLGRKYVVEDKVPKNEQIPGTDLYVWTNLSCNSIRNLIRKILQKYGYKRDSFQIYLRADYSDLHRGDVLPDRCSVPEDEEKIGKLVKKTMQQLSDSNHKFSSNELLAMQSAQWCKNTLGLYEVMLKKYNPELDITSQITISGYPRFWKDLFVFNGEKYFVTSQWYERHRAAFVEWAKQFDCNQHE